MINVRHYQRQFNLRLKWIEALIKEHSLVVDILILHNFVNDCCEKLSDKLKMKMVITVLEE
jgi:hypothetical protein